MVKTAIHAGVWATSSNPELASRVMAAAKEAGFDALALPLRNPESLQTAALAKAFQAVGLRALGTTGLTADGDISASDPDQRRRGEAHLTRVIQLAAEIGIEQINGVFYGPLGHANTLPDKDALRRSAEIIGRVADLAERVNILLCVELVNRYETALLNCADQGLAYLELVNHPNVWLHLDTYHMAIEEPFPARALERALPKLGYYELDQSHRGRLDEGSLDLRAISAPIVGRYDGWVGVEAFARSRLDPGHADLLAVWRDHFDDGTALAHHARALIREIFEQGA